MAGLAAGKPSDEALRKGETQSLTVFGTQGYVTRPARLLAQDSRGMSLSPFARPPEAKIRYHRQRLPHRVVRQSRDLFSIAPFNRDHRHSN